MKYVGIQSSIWANRWRVGFLLICFPFVVAALLYVVFFGIFYYGDPVSLASVTARTTDEIVEIFSVLGPMIVLFGIVSFWFQKELMFRFSGAREMQRKESPDLYNLVENLAISRGLPVPKIGVIESGARNAFALGWKPSNSWIVFTSGLITALDEDEVEAVAAHELTHIMNKDSLVMVLMAIYVGVILSIGHSLTRTSHRGRNRKGAAQGLIIGGVFLLAGYVFLPLFQLAVSRKREFLADAGSVELTKNSDALISALQKIHGHSLLGNIKNSSIAAMCIDNTSDDRFLREAYGQKKRSRFMNLFSTHPSIEERIEALKSYM